MLLFRRVLLSLMMLRLCPATVVLTSVRCAVCVLPCSSLLSLPLAVQVNEGLDEVGVDSILLGAYPSGGGGGGGDDEEGDGQGGSSYNGGGGAGAGATALTAGASAAITAAASSEFVRKRTRPDEAERSKQRDAERLRAKLEKEEAVKKAQEKAAKELSSALEGAKQSTKFLTDKNARSKWVLENPHKLGEARTPQAIQAQVRKGLVSAISEAGANNLSEEQIAEAQAALDAMPEPPPEAAEPQTRRRAPSGRAAITPPWSRPSEEPPV